MKLSRLAFPLLLVMPAMAAFAPARLVDVVNSSLAIVDITITSGRTVSGTSARFGPFICGGIFEATANQNLKGPIAESVIFATQQPLAVPSQHIVFLYDYAGNFPSDTPLSPDEQSELDACTSQLPSLKSNSFLSKLPANPDYVEIGTMVPPEELEPYIEAGMIETSRMRNWLRRQISEGDR